MNKKTQWDYLELGKGDNPAKVLSDAQNTAEMAEVLVENLAQFVDLQEAERVLGKLRDFVDGKRTGYMDATTILTHMDKVLQTAKENGADVTHIELDLPPLKRAARVGDLELLSKRIDLDMQSEGDKRATFSITLEAFKRAIDKAEELNIDVSKYALKFEKAKFNAIIHTVIS